VKHLKSPADSKATADILDAFFDCEQPRKYISVVNDHDGIHAVMDELPVDLFPTIRDLTGGSNSEFARTGN